MPGSVRLENAMLSINGRARRPIRGYWATLHREVIVVRAGCSPWRAAAEKKISSVRARRVGKAILLDYAGAFTRLEKTLGHRKAIRHIQDTDLFYHSRLFESVTLED